MRMLFLTAAMAALALTSVVGDASAKSRRHVYVAETYGSSIPLTVNRRSWLDPGPAVTTYGAQPAYMAASTQFAKTQDHYVGGDRYGNDVIIGQPYVPGRTAPVVEFSTLPDGNVDADVTVTAQNYYFNPAPSLPAPNYQPTTYLPY